MIWRVTVIYGRGLPSSETFDDLEEAFMFVRQRFDASSESDGWQEVIAVKIERQ